MSPPPPVSAQSELAHRILGLDASRVASFSSASASGNPFEEVKAVPVLVKHRIVGLADPAVREQLSYIALRCGGPAPGPGALTWAVDGTDTRPLRLRVAGLPEDLARSLPPGPDVHGGPGGDDLGRLADTLHATLQHLSSLGHGTGSPATGLARLLFDPAARPYTSVSTASTGLAATRPAPGPVTVAVGVAQPPQRWEFRLNRGDDMPVQGLFCWPGGGGGCHGLIVVSHQRHGGVCGCVCGVVTPCMACCVVRVCVCVCLQPWWCAGQARLRRRLRGPALPPPPP